MDRPAFYLVSFLTNAAILVFEITGGRLLAPYLGTSVGVWAGLIAVVLGGMALGYHYGGRLGDRDASRERISLVLFLAGLAALLAWSLRDVLPTWMVSEHVSVVLGAVVVGALLFMPTVILLAAVSPLLAKNLIQSLKDSAKVVGELNAVGTVGSIAGALATGLLLIPSFGIDTILLGIAIVILLLAYSVSGKNYLKRSGILAGVIVCALFFNTLPTTAGSVVADISTAYNRIFITNENFNGATRALWTSPFGIQCQMYVDDYGNVDETRLVEDYLKAHDVVIADAFPQGPTRALFLGGCIESFPRYLLHTYPETVADVVEIDPGMVNVAEEYFGFDPSHFPTLSNIVDDARTFVNKDHGPYDLIYLDAFGSAGRVPFQLMTEEMFERVAANLSEDGMLIVNTHGSYEGGGALYPSVYVKTARTAFPHAELYQFTGEPQVSQNLILIASKARTLPETFTSSARPEVIVRRAPTRNDVITLTDNYAPVEGIFPENLITSHR